MNTISSAPSLSDTPVIHEPSEQLIKLIRKLRWIGKEQEAHMLEDRLGLLPPMQRGSVLADPISTD